MCALLQERRESAVRGERTWMSRVWPARVTIGVRTWTIRGFSALLVESGEEPLAISKTLSQPGPMLREHGSGYKSTQ
jgi:hypothetical protein